MSARDVIVPPNLSALPNGFLVAAASSGARHEMYYKVLRDVRDDPTSLADLDVPSFGARSVMRRVVHGFALTAGNIPMSLDWAQSQASASCRTGQSSRSRARRSACTLT